MSISLSSKRAMAQSSWIRKMFETGNELKQQYGSENVFDFSLGNPIQEPPKKFFEILEKLIQTREKGSHRYMSNNGYNEVRQSISSYINKRLSKTKIESNDLIMTVGAAGAINIIMKSILDPNDEVILIKPYFPEYYFYVTNHNGKVVFAESNDSFNLDLNEIEKVITAKTKAIIINSPNNPTGVVYDESILQKLAILLQKYEQKYGNAIYVISDEPYRKINYVDNSLPEILDIFENGIFCTSHSKDLGLAGERIGYLAVSPNCNQHDELISALIFANRVLGFVNAPAIMQKAIAQLQEESVDIEDYQKKRNYIYDKLSFYGYKLQKPNGAFYYFIKSPIENDIDFVKYLAENYHILVVPGSGFGRQGYFRLSYCVEEQTIVKAMPLFENALKNLLT